jgi:PAS domain S-box-containing protein
MRFNAALTAGKVSDDDLPTIVIGAAIESANASACSLLGVAADALSGKDLTAVAASRQRNARAAAEAWDTHARAARSGVPQSFPWRFRRPDGSSFDALVEMHTRVDGRLLARLRSLRELTAAHRELRDTEQSLQQIMDNTSAAIFVKDLDGRFLFVNREFERMQSRPLDAIVGRLDVDVFPTSADELRRNDARVVDERRAIDFEETVDTAQGRRIYLSHKFPLLDALGQPYAVCGIATDITDRKRSEDALRAAALAVSSAEGSDLFRELVRYLSRILETDVAFIATFGDESRTMMRSLAAILDGKILRPFEYRLEGTPCAKVVGREFQFVASGVYPEFKAGTIFAEKGMDSYAALPLNDTAGRPLGLIAVMDRKPLGDPQLSEAMLTIFATRAAAEIERRRAVQALSDSEASYRSIFEASEDAIFVHDWDTGGILDVSPAAEAMYGFSADELKRMSVADFSAIDENFTQDEALRRIERAKAGEIVRFESRVRHRSGRTAWHEVRLKPATIAGKRRILAYTRDIGAAKSANEALRASEEQYRAIFEASVDGLALGDAEGRLVDANPAFVRMLGHMREDVVGHDGLRFITPELRNDCEAHFRRVIDGQPCQMDAQAQRRNGTVFDVEVRGVPMIYREQPHVLVIVRDLTERRRADRERAKLEAQLRQAQKMEALGHLTGGVAHDFNNLLTSIMGYIALGSERDSTAGDPHLSKYLEQANLSCLRARDLIQQMLTFSRGRKGEPRPLSLALLVRESVKLLRSSFPSSVEIATALDDDAPAVRLDPVHLEQVLMNLAINARDALRGSGRIDVIVRRVSEPDVVCASCRGSLAGEFVELAVADNGPGIPPEIAERMFEPFFTTKEVGRGTGMGLSTVHGIVHEHGGHVIVESRPGAGARFRVLWPALASAIAPVEALPAGQALPRAQLRGRVLIVEDEEAVARFMCDLLEHWGLSVVFVANPSEALAAIREDAGFDVVVTDQTMPGMTGLELAKRITAERPDLPVLLYTGYGDGLTQAMLEAAGVRRLLHKPLDVSAAFAALSAALAERTR